MEGIEKITAKIAQDAQADVERVERETQAQIESLRAQTQAQIQKETEELLSKGRLAADERLERLQSAAKMERRKLELGAKQEVLGEAFDQALERLCQLPEEEYVSLLTRLAVEASTTGREQLIFSARDRSPVGKQVVVAANEALVGRVAPELPESITESKVGAFLGKVVNTTTAMVTGTGMLTLSQETRNIQGGFIMVDRDVEINCAFETLIRLQREKLEREVARVLFQE